MANGAPFKPQGLDHLLLVVTDLERTLDFYLKVVGCGVEARLPQFGMIELSGGVSLVNAASPEGAWARFGDSTGQNLDHFCMGISGCSDAALRAHLERHEVAIEEERDEDGRLSLYIRDPSGNAVELMNKTPR